MTNTKYSPEELIAAIATALAPGALGIVRTSGSGCIEAVSKIFSRPKALKEAQGNTLVYGWILDGTEKIDEVLVSVFRAPKSFTGEEMCEISCHGGVAVVNAVYETLLKNGFRPAERGEFTFRAYINGKADLTKVEAVREIIDSKTNAGRSHAADRLSGELYKEIDSIKTLVTDTLAAIEVDIEYPEDEETIADSFNPSSLEEAENRLGNLVSSWKSEKLYQEGVKIVLAGKTNAGKSSLFNALLKEDRSIVSDIEGTTRDWIESWISFDGIPARLFDTAGLRKTDDVIEAKGVELTKGLASNADLVLYLVDSAAGLSDEDKKFIKENNEIPLIVVFNKTDLADKEKISEMADKELKDFLTVKISAKKGTGTGDLTSIVKKVILGEASAKSEGTGLGSERQKESVLQAHERVKHALEISRDSYYGLDAVVQDLEDALDSLGEVTGEVTPDDVLGSIFSHFCVGK
jgi:tRNA modification GTPase